MIRLFDIVISILVIIILLPVFLILSVLIKLSSRGPVIFKQSRVGRFNHDFLVFKFRTMYVNSDTKGLLTVGSKDGRVTPIGFYLRIYKLDELPQLFNVLFGQMSLVGPRPEVRKFVEVYDASQREILQIRPGITDWASIIYKDENALLEFSKNPEEDYIQKIIPDKIKYNRIFLEKYNLSEYFKILFNTAIKLLNNLQLQNQRKTNNF